MLIDDLKIVYENFTNICNNIPDKFQELYFSKLLLIIYYVKYLINNIEIYIQKFLKCPESMYNHTEYFNYDHENMENS